MNWNKYFKNFVIFILFTAIVLSLAFGLACASPSARNSRTDNVWNNGICKTCEIRFEPFAVSTGVRYYFCRECGTEVLRFG